MRGFALIIAFAGIVPSLSSCADEPPTAEPFSVHSVDPYVARALNDPLMVDPDLAYRNEANAAITIGFDHALPSLRGSDESARAARETARLMLLEDGPIPDLPQPSAAPGPASLEAAYSVAAVLDAVDAPPACRRDIRGDFSLAANLPEVATIMPHGMVRLAAAAAQPDCEMRLVRYVTPASIADVLQFHYTMAKRADMEPAIHVLPEASLIADRRGRFLRVFARESAGNLTAVDLVTWTD